MTLTAEISADTQALLLLTAQLIAGRRDVSPELLQPTEYRRFARFLHENGWEPADLLAKDTDDLLVHDRLPIDSDRLQSLLARGFLLSQAIEQWSSRAIWVIGITDDAYPTRLARLEKHAPPILYGCGSPALLNGGGLAVVGSRSADDDLLHYAASIGERAARAACALVSGGARGVDQAAMRGALEAGGQAVGVLSNDLGRAALHREHRGLLMGEQLTLVSPYDPAAGFNIGNAMQRNKAIYALADAALVASSDFQQGGTWAGAVEQLDKLKLVPVYVRSETGKAFESLIRKGARRWPEPETTEAFQQALARQASQPTVRKQASFWPELEAASQLGRGR